MHSAVTYCCPVVLYLVSMPTKGKQTIPCVESLYNDIVHVSCSEECYNERCQDAMKYACDESSAYTRPVFCTRYESSITTQNVR
jgi:hypothetical protein